VLLLLLGKCKSKELHTAEESLVKPAAVKMAKIMCSDAVPNTLATSFVKQHHQVAHP